MIPELHIMTSQTDLLTLNFFVIFRVSNLMWKKNFDIVLGLVIRDF